MTPPSPMPPQAPNPLDALEPNILPAPIGFWPPAVGWWIVAGLALLLILVLAYALWRWYKSNVYRREAVRQLTAIQQSYTTHKSASRLVQQYNHLLKAVALQRYPREQVASLHGNEWLTFLDQQLKSSTDFTKGAGNVLGHSAYSKNVNLEADILHTVATRWVKKHRVNKPVNVKKKEGKPHV
ncbi:DUF4381 domain-containing protein [Sansalvadorimonas verongulae]|uniref:DUF4381 domain-containing protein n=1 Tax=Sansalvadorimonas verongulae TaxID=2172824 RepID=UPI0012BC3C96|nr:DUF4381 domain-containing protein [Sansalvadorimonas verongulae]MTI15395.1 DUF4381 domain-containing protein [Sansalvadorimonas verongulae]